MGRLEEGQGASLTQARDRSPSIRSWASDSVKITAMLELDDRVAGTHRRRTHVAELRGVRGDRGPSRSDRERRAAERGGSRRCVGRNVDDVVFVVGRRLRHGHGGRRCSRRAGRGTRYVSAKARRARLHDRRRVLQRPLQRGSLLREGVPRLRRGLRSDQGCALLRRLLLRRRPLWVVHRAGRKSCACPRRRLEPEVVLLPRDRRHDEEVQVAVGDEPLLSRRPSASSGDRPTRSGSR